MRWSPCPAYAARTPPDLHRCSSPTWGTDGQRRRGPLTGAHPSLEGTPAHLRPRDMRTFCPLIRQKCFVFRRKYERPALKEASAQKNLVRLDLQTWRGRRGKDAPDVSEGAPHTSSILGLGLTWWRLDSSVQEKNLFRKYLQITWLA